MPLEDSENSSGQTGKEDQKQMYRRTGSEFTTVPLWSSHSLDLKVSAVLGGAQWSKVSKATDFWPGNWKGKPRYLKSVRKIAEKVTIWESDHIKLFVDWRAPPSAARVWIWT